VSEWMSVRVLLVAGQGERLAEPPGRVLLAHADHTFAEFADAVDSAFGRWDLTPLHVFAVEGRRLVAGADGNDDEDSEEVTLGDVGLREGARFQYLFDPGEGWEHECIVEAMGLDPYQASGEEPTAPVPTFGWGTIPDQYGRTSDEDVDDEPALAGEAALDDDEAVLLAAWDDAEREAWGVVAQALEGVERAMDETALAEAVARVRADETADTWPYDVLWAAGGLDDDAPSASDEQLWLDLAVGVVAPEAPLPLDPDAEASWAALEPADWAAAVIELARRGVGTAADPDSVVALIRRCPEIEGEALTEEDEEVLREGLETVVALWHALGAVDEELRLTALGRWGLPEALRIAWAEG
jgi:hypothetical protein